AMDGSQIGSIGKGDSPRTYDQFVAVKKAYDKLMEKRGFPGTDMQMVWSEVNSYMLNHGTKPSTQAVQCGECHDRKQSGAWSALIGPTSILGDQGSKNLVDFYELRGKAAAWKIPDQRLLDEGYVRFDPPYLKRDAATGDITARTGDVLYATKVDPFMSIAKNSSAKTIFGDLRQSNLSAVMGDINMTDDAYRKALDATSGKTPVFYFNTSHGTEALQDSAIIALGGGIADLVLPQYRLSLDVYADLPQDVVKTLEAKVAGSKLTSSAFWFYAKDQQNKPIAQFMAPVYVKLPYKGKATTADGVRVLTSTDGSSVNQLDAQAVFDVKPDNDEQKGYIIFQTSKIGWFAVLDVKK
ncbi:MAG: hypothetical protein NTV00_03430, partial [Methylococcales bacterium]|nr:hypothetical protein [Methylococcales bacterium]